MKRSQPRLLAASIAALLVSLPAWQSPQAQEVPSTAETGASASPQSDTATAAPDNTADAAASTPLAETTASNAATSSAASTSTQGTSLRRIWAWMQPISSQGVRADVLARALTASTTNNQGRQVAVPWSQAMPGGIALNGTGHASQQLEQNQLDGNRLQYLSHDHQDTRDTSIGLQQVRTEIGYTLPSGPLDNLAWARPGPPLLSIGQSSFNILEYRAPGSTWFRRRHSAGPQAASELVLKQGEHIAFDQVLQDWNTGAGPQQWVQLMVLRGERPNQFRVCLNTNTILVHQLSCNVWQVPGSYWRRPQPLTYVGPYFDIASGSGPRYLRYPQ